MIRLAVAEDNAFLLQNLLEDFETDQRFNIKYTAENGRDLMDLVDQDISIDVILMDIEMPVMDGIEATTRIKAKHPQIKIIMLTVFEDYDNIIRSIQAGASGYLLKDETFNNLSQGILDVMDGGASMTSSIALKALQMLRSTPLESTESMDFNLTARETEVLQHIGHGLTYKEIAENLFISSSTVRKHIENVYHKLNVHSKVEAIATARKNRLI